MNSKNNILLISEDENFAKILESKLIFLRHNDSVIVSNYENATSNIELFDANVILVNENSNKLKTIELIKAIRCNKSLCIILLAASYDKEMILASYDAGIDDFALANADDFELVIRIVNNIKHNSIKQQGLRNSMILEQLNVLDDLTGLYNYKYARQVIENVIDAKLLDDGMFIVIAPSDESKTKFSVEKMATAIFASIRSDDIATLGKGAKFYLLLPKTDINGAVTVLNKIKENYDEDFELRAGISSITHKNFEDMERGALQALSDAIATNTEYVVIEEKDNTLEDWLDIDECEHKSYKLFRQMFNKKLEKVIAPVFYRLQKAWEEKLFDTEIEQYTDSEQCVFHLKNENQDSTLRIIYPGFTKILISITHEGLDSPENSEIQLSLTQISQKELISIVENFIKDFKYTSN